MTNEKMIEKRTELEAELAKGQQALAALQKQQSTTIATMQRIQGAIQFINEQIEVPPQDVDDPAPETPDESERT